LRELEAVTLADDRALRRRLQYQDVLAALEAQKKKGVAADDVRARLELRIALRRAQEQLKQRLLLHVNKGMEPAIRFRIAAGIEGTAFEANDSGLKIRAQPGSGNIEVPRAFAAFEREDLARTFGALPNLRPIDRLALAFTYADFGDLDRARRDLDRVLRDDDELKERFSAAAAELEEAPPPPSPPSPGEK
jgi:hypothetical protein